MANFTKLLLLIIAINMVFLWTGIVDVPGNTLIDVMKDPSLISEDGFFWKWIWDNMLSVGGLGLITAGTLIFKSDTMIFAGMAMVFLTYMLPLYQVWQLIANDAGSIISGIIVIPIIALYVMTLLAWWRGRAT